MKKVTLLPYFAIAFFSHLALPFFSTLFPFLYFAPFFTTCYSRSSLFYSIWVSFFIGLFLDMCTTSTPLGFYPICAILTTLALHRFKIYFLEDKPLPFSLYTGLYSFTYTLIFTFIHSFLDQKFRIAPLSFLLDITLLPILDTIYHLLFFTLPVMFFVFATAREQRVRILRLRKKLFAQIPKLKRILVK